MVLVILHTSTKIVICNYVLQFNPLRIITTTLYRLIPFTLSCPELYHILLQLQLCFTPTTYRITSYYTLPPTTLCLTLNFTTYHSTPLLQLTLSPVAYHSISCHTSPYPLPHITLLPTTFYSQLLLHNVVEASRFAEEVKKVTGLLFFTQDSRQD